MPVEDLEVLQMVLLIQLKYHKQQVMPLDKDKMLQVQLIPMVSEAAEAAGMVVICITIQAVQVVQVDLVI